LSHHTEIIADGLSPLFEIRISHPLTRPVKFVKRIIHLHFYRVIIQIPQGLGDGRIKICPVRSEVESMFQQFPAINIAGRITGVKMAEQDIVLLPALPDIR